MGKSLYDILDLDENAAPLNIKNAYLRLKIQYEQNLPEDDDRHISAIQYQAIGEAYAVLSNPTRREIYDKKLITDRQDSYSSVAKPSGFPILKVLILTLLAVITWLGYAHYQRTQAQHQLELKRIELEKEQARVKQEELQLAAEEAKENKNNCSQPGRKHGSGNATRRKPDTTPRNWRMTWQELKRPKDDG